MERDTSQPPSPVQISTGEHGFLNTHVHGRVSTVLSGVGALGGIPFQIVKWNVRGREYFYLLVPTERLLGIRRGDVLEVVVVTAGLFITLKVRVMGVYPRRTQLYVPVAYTPLVRGLYENKALAVITYVRKVEAAP